MSDHAASNAMESHAGPMGTQHKKLTTRIFQRVLPRNSIGDFLYSVALYWKKNKRMPRLWRPKSFNEKLLALKLSRQGLDPLRQFITDKEFVKEFVLARITDEYNDDTIAVFDNLDQLRGFEWPLDCVVKPTHLSREVIIRRDGKPDISASQLAEWLATNYYEMEREKNYRYLRPKIIVEELLLDVDEQIPNDYKIFCFSGKPKFIQVDVGRFGTHLRACQSLRWTRLPFSTLYPQPPDNLPRPARLQDMIDIASKLSRGLEFVRIDLYAIGNEIKVGEMTNWPGNGVSAFIPPEADGLVGRLFEDADQDVEALFGLPSQVYRT